MNSITVTNYYIQIIADSTDEQLYKLINTVTGVYKTRSKDTYRCSIRKLPEVLYVMRNITSVDQLSGNMRNFYIAELERRERTQLLKKYGPDEDLTSNLWKHQRLGVELAQVNKRYNFFYDTRTGKTRMALQIMQDALMTGEAKRCLVVCPATIVQSWLTDAKEFPLLKVVAFYKDGKHQDTALNTPAHIIIWSSGTFANYIELLKTIHFDICFFDESSKLKNYRSEISKAALQLSLSIPSWYNLSATPAPNGEHEYYTQMMILDPYCFNPARTKFVEKYFDDKSRNNNYEKLIIKQNMYDEFMKIINDYSVYVDQSVMPTAGKEWHTVEFDLGAVTREFYSSMKSEMAIEVGDRQITAAQAAIMRGKLNQIASGFIIDTDAKKQNFVTRKLDLDDEVQQEIYVLNSMERVHILETLLHTLGSTQVVIWANYAFEFECINALLGDRARYIRGGSSIKDKEDAITLFKNHKLQYLVCHPCSIGMGINLTEAHNAVYYSMTDSWEALKQSSERIYGHVSVQPNKCHYWIIQAKDTVNVLMYDNVSHKRDASTGFLEYLKAGI